MKKKTTPTKKNEKATLAESELRTSLVYEMIVKGCNKNYIVRFCTEKYNIRLRQIEVYIARATEQIKENYGKKYKENIMSKHLAQLDNLFVKNYTIEDFRECRNLIESKNKMLGIGQSSNSKVSLTIDTDGFSEEKQKRLDELKAKLLLIENKK